MLERDAGWGGILVDANPVYWPRLAARAAYSSSSRREDRGPKTLVVGALIGGCEEGEIAEFAASDKEPMLGGVVALGTDQWAAEQKMRQAQAEGCTAVEGHLPGQEQLVHQGGGQKKEGASCSPPAGGPRHEDLLLGVNKKLLPQVPFDTLLDRFGAPPVIDYLSLDVEGYECDVLTEKVLDKYDFRVLTIERPHVGRNGEAGLPHRLMKRGYISFSTIGPSSSSQIHLPDSPRMPIQHPCPPHRVVSSTEAGSSWIGDDEDPQGSGVASKKLPVVFWAAAAYHAGLRRITSESGGPGCWVLVRWTTSNCFQLHRRYVGLGARTEHGWEGKGKPHR